MKQRIRFIPLPDLTLLFVFLLLNSSLISKDIEDPAVSRQHNHNSQSKPASSLPSCNCRETTQPADTSQVNRLRSSFDSLAKASARLIKTLENDSMLRNSKTIKQLNHSLDGLKNKVDQYQRKMNAAIKQEPTES